MNPSFLFLAPALRIAEYLDPGSGSFLIQLLLATALGALFILRTSWGKIKTFFTRLFSSKDDASKVDASKFDEEK
jgi:hypothetical protein